MVLFPTHVTTRHNITVDRLVHACWNRLSWLDGRTDLSNVVGTIVINQQRCSCMIEHFVREWWNNKIEQRCYNNHELGCCIESGFACSNILEQPLSIRQAVTICWNTIEQYCYFTNPVLGCYQSCYRVVEPIIIITSSWFNKYITFFRACIL